MIATQQQHQQAPATEMPRYRSIKTVWALKIHMLEPGEHGALITPAEHGYAPFWMEAAWVNKHQPKQGGYVVQYEDGYRSFSPAEAFEKGNIPESEYGLQRAQEPKYGTNARGRVFNRSTGAEIPADEPLMIFRASDRKAFGAIVAYMERCDNADHRAVVQSRALDFESFATTHPSRMGEPDSSLGDLHRAKFVRTQRA
jgi:hypothetical protein